MTGKDAKQLKMLYSYYGKHGSSYRVKHVYHKIQQFHFYIFTYSMLSHFSRVRLCATP